MNKILFEIYENVDFTEIMESLKVRKGHDRPIILNDKYNVVEITWDLVSKSHLISSI